MEKPLQKSKVRIDFINYDKDHFEEKKDVPLEECLNKGASTWITIYNANDEIVQSVVSKFGWHPLIAEEILRDEQRSKVTDYKEYLYFKLHLLKYNKDKDVIDDHQLSLVLNRNTIVTFVKIDNDVLEPVRQQLRDDKSHLRSQGVDYLVYTILDVIIDHYFEIMELVDQQLEDLEEKLIKKPNSGTVVKIQHFKRKIFHLRKVIWPMRELLSHLKRLESPLIQDSTKVYIQDVYDHTIQMIDTVENFRDIVSEMFDIYLSNINLRMNEIMKVLTIVATIFVPLTFVTSMYGMNFDYIPGMHSKWGYYICLLIMAFMAAGMVWFFRRKKWI